MYEIGQFFRLESASGRTEIYILAACDVHRCVLIDLLSGNRWTDSYEVEEYGIVNDNEFDLLTNNNSERFVPIELDYSIKEPESTWEV